METDQEFSFDPTRVMHRRNLLKLLAGTGVVALVGCGSSNRSTSSATTPTSTTGTTGTTGTTAAAATMTAIPDETGGPFPADGSNGPDVLSESGVVRRDITKSFGSLSGTADGVPATIKLTVLDTNNSGAPLAGAAVYVWHCDREGRYSLYSSLTDQNYLRGVQVADADGVVTFDSIFPACYSGRWPHIHFEVYASVDDATGGGTKIKTSQIALPEAVCDTVFATEVRPECAEPRPDVARERQRLR